MVTNSKYWNAPLDTFHTQRWHQKLSPGLVLQRNCAKVHHYFLKRSRNIHVALMYANKSTQIYTKKVTPCAYVDCFACKDVLTSFRNAFLSLSGYTRGTFKKKSQFATPGLQREYLGSKFQSPYASYESLYPLQNYCNEKIFFFWGKAQLKWPPLLKLKQEWNEESDSFL